jgi:hypothetical protein
VESRETVAQLPRTSPQEFRRDVSLTSAQLPGNCRTVEIAMPPNFRASNSRDNPQSGAQLSGSGMSQSEQQTMQHPAKHLTRRLVEVLASRFQS